MSASSSASVNTTAGLSLHRRRQLLQALPSLARRAGAAIMQVYQSDFAVRGKADASPVTEADERAEALILPELARLAPDMAAVSEEAAAKGGFPAVGACFWLVDPLDGTREFVNRNGEFTVNIALIEHGRPTAGVVYAPAQERMYFGGEGLGAFREQDGQATPIHCRRPPPAGLTVVASRSHGDEAALQQFLSQRGERVAGVAHSGSSLKLCLVAEGEADLYPRLGRTMEWDIAAGHAVLRAAGGRVATLDGGELGYGKAGFENPHFVASGTAG